MKKTLALLLVASLLLAGCTELSESDDGETLNIEVNEDIAIEKIADFMTVDEGESFGITMMYDMDPSMMGMDEGMLEVDEDSEAVITIEMTEAWSPDGYHTSSIMGISDGNSSMKFVTSMTHIGTTMYVEMGYVTQGDLCADEETQEDKEMCEMMFGDMPDVQSYSMTTTTTHTEVIAAMAEETASNDDGMDPMAMLEFFAFVECSGSFTPADSVDGLQIFDVSMEGMDDDSISPSMALCITDTDDSGGVSFEEFMSMDETDQDDITAMQTAFDDADTNSDDELTIDELEAFITAVDSHYEDDDHDHDEMGDDHDDDESTDMPDMSVAFNDAGEIEYFGMSMDGTDMQMYVLTEDKVSAFFSGAEAGELVALPFVISSDMGDDYDSGDDDYYEETFRCDDGETIPMDYVNDGEEDCDGGEDEDTTDGSDNGGDNGEDQNSEDDGPPSPQSLLDMTDTDQNGLMDFDEFITFLSEGDGEESAEYMTQSVIDEFNEIFNSSDLDESGDLDLDELELFILDLDEYMSTSDDGHDEMWTFNREMSECDSDADGMVDFDELDACVTMDIANDGYGDEGVAEQSLRWMFDLVDADEDGMLDSDEFEDFAEMTSGEPMMVCYDRYADEIDSSITSYEDCEAGDNNWIQALQPVNDGGSDSEDEFRCDDGETIPMDWVNDGEEDCAGGEDEDDMGGSGGSDSEDEFRCDDGETIPMNWVNDGEEDCVGGEDEMQDMDDDHDHGDHDGHGDHDDSGEIVMYISNEMDFHFEGDMSDYKIELASCDYDYDMETGEETSTCTTVMSVAMADAGMDSDIVFHDADSSGTVSVGDMIHIGETAESWDTVRLYSISADAYSDENPMHDAPGFTGLVGMLALLGAAFIRRNE